MLTLPTYRRPVAVPLTTRDLADALERRLHGARAGAATRPALGGPPRGVVVMAGSPWAFEIRAAARRPRGGGW